MKKLLIIYIIFALILIGCKKEIPSEPISEPIRHEVFSSRGYVLINDVQYFTPAVFYWKPKESYTISTLGAWTGDRVNVTIRKNGLIAKEESANGSVEFVYYVQP